jgi:NAD(P)H-hydrate epimerase
MREVDRLTTERFAIPSLLLMENAAGAVATEIAALFPDGLRNKRIVIVCGRGNNGGDGAALARRLWIAGCRVTAVLLGRIADTSGDARINLEIVQRIAAETSTDNGQHLLELIECDEENDFASIEISLRTYDVIVDAMFGTGLSRPVEGIYLRAVQAINRISGEHKPLIVSIDIPSGLNSDLPTLVGEAVHADLTVTFTRPKIANVLPPASDLSKRTVVATIGSPVSLIKGSGAKFFLVEEADASGWLERTRYARGSFKNSHGHALVIAGSRNMTGAAVLSSEAAMCAGAGLVTISTSKSALPFAAPRLMPEVMSRGVEETASGAIAAEAIEAVLALAKRMTVAAIGPGLSNEEDSTRRFVREFVERREIPLVIDADALNALSPWPSELRGSAGHPLILTPHPGEMARLVGSGGKIEPADRTRVATEFAAKHSVILVLKGERTVIADPNGRLFVSPTGNPGLGTAGSGDTLTGIITGFLSQEYGMFGGSADPLSATLAAIFVGGLAGDLAARELGMRPMVASDVRRHLSQAIVSLDPEGEIP